MRKPKVLIVGDSPVLHTGFGLVTRKVATYLHSTDKYEVKALGWFHRPTDIVVPFEIYPTKKDNPQIAEQDKYSQFSLPEIADSYKPDIVIAVGDFWMLEHMCIPASQRKHKLVIYVPIDGMPMMQRYSTMLKNVDQVVSYGPFGTSVIKERVPELDIVEIPHGVDSEIFKPMQFKEYAHIHKSITGGNPYFMIGTFSRNQPRKMFPRLIKAAALFVSGYSVCDKCGELFFEDNMMTCKMCGSETLSYGSRKDDVRFYFHMALNDCGWNIAELANRFGLGGMIAYPQGLQIGKGVPEDMLVQIYNSMDVFTLPTGGEGWGLTIIEAMSCGLPVIVPDYSAHVDYVKGAGELIKISEFFTEAMTNVERCLVDIYDYTMRLDKMYMEDSEAFKKKWGKYIEATYPGCMDQFIVTGTKAREFLGRAARKRAEKYSWKNACKQWENLIDTSLKDVTLDTETTIVNHELI